MISNNISTKSNFSGFSQTLKNALEIISNNIFIHNQHMKNNFNDTNFNYCYINLHWISINLQHRTKTVENF